jgi:hypothetical protein
LIVLLSWQPGHQGRVYQLSIRESNYPDPPTSWLT